jgi:hypothetical protein
MWAPECGRLGRRTCAVLIRQSGFCNAAVSAATPRVTTTSLRRGYSRPTRPAVSTLILPRFRRPKCEESVWLSTEVPLSTKGYWGMGILMLTICLVNFVKYRFDARQVDDRIRQLKDAKNERMLAEYVTDTKKS